MCFLCFTVFRLEPLVLVVWFDAPKCILCTIAFRDHMLSNRTGATDGAGPFEQGRASKGLDAVRQCNAVDRHVLELIGFLNEGK
jgi:hypothetical protein